MPKKPARRPAKPRPATKTKAAPRRVTHAAPRRVAQPAAPQPAAPQPVERHGLIELAGKPATVIGEDVRLGQQAPEFNPQANDWSEVNVIATTTGKVRILTALPSLSTDVCDRETRRFNQEAAALGDDVVVIAVSVDLPPTQRHWCAAAGVDRVRTYSDHMNLEFGLKYGCWIKERRWLRRAVFVVDRNDTITYAAYMRGIGVEPNYAEVLEAARAVLRR